MRWRGAKEEGGGSNVVKGMNGRRRSKSMDVPGKEEGRGSNVVEGFNGRRRSKEDGCTGKKSFKNKDRR